jgi:hypothetical protein
MRKVSPARRIRERIERRRLQDYIQAKCCNKLAKIYWINLERKFGEGFTGRVVAPEPQTAVYYFLSRRMDYSERKFNRLYREYEGNKGIGRFARLIGRFG